MGTIEYKVLCLLLCREVGMTLSQLYIFFCLRLKSQVRYVNLICVTTVGALNLFVLALHPMLFFIAG
jgi:hypothetical protein